MGGFWQHPSAFHSRALNIRFCITALRFTTFLSAHLLYIVANTNSDSAGEKYVLIDWVGEDSYSVVNGGRMNDGVFRVGDSQ